MARDIREDKVRLNTLSLNLTGTFAPLTCELARIGLHYLSRCEEQEALLEHFTTLTESQAERLSVLEPALERAIVQLREARWCPPDAECRMRVKGQSAGAEEVCAECWRDYLTEKEGEK